MDPEQYKEYVDHMSDLEAHNLALKSDSMAETLKRQATLEHAAHILAHKVSVLEKLLDTVRADLTRSMIEAAEHRQKVLDLYMPKSLKVDHE